MSIEIVGSNEGDEREAAEALKTVLSPFVGDGYRLHIIVSPQALGEKNQDIDLLLLGTFGRGIKFTGSFGDADGKAVRLVNLCLIIEVKDHSRQFVQFDSQTVNVKYANSLFWRDATKQMQGQRQSLLNFIERNGLKAPYIVPLLWLRNFVGSVPKVNANVLTANPTLQDFLRVLERVRVPRQDTKDDSFYISFAKNEDVKAIEDAKAFFMTKIVPTNLDRKRLENITKKETAGQQYIEKLGTQLLLFHGRGGSGKTVHILRLALYLWEQGDRPLFLTYNKALVADITRLMTIHGKRFGFENRLEISTAHSFFRRMLAKWGVWPYETNESSTFEKKYTDGKLKLVELLSGDTRESLLEDRTVLENPDIFGWDYVLIDEGQDWPEDERDLLYKFFKPERCVVADGVDQLVRAARRCDWTAPNKQTVPLRKALRMKSDLCRFVKAFAEHLNIEWNQKVNDEVHGGKVTIIDGPYTRGQHDEIFESHRTAGNEPVDALFCVPPDRMVAGPLLTEQLAQWGNQVWDGTSEDTRETFPTDLNQFRVVRYESCRGLEGWTVVCIALEKFFEHRIKHAGVDSEPQLFDKPNDYAERMASLWTLIPLTRAIDHLVIQLDGPGRVSDVCKALANEYPEFVALKKTAPF